MMEMQEARMEISRPAKARSVDSGDRFQFYGELNVDRDPELGAGIGSISYTYPLSRMGRDSSFGASQAISH